MPHQTTQHLPTHQTDKIISDRYPGLMYLFLSGHFYRLSDNPEKTRRIFPDENGLLNYYCFKEKKSIKKKAITLAWELLNSKKLPSNSINYFKDLNPENYKGSNIGIISKANYKKLKDALYNLEHGVKLIPHKTDAFVYILKYKSDGKLLQTTFHDISTALKMKRRIIFKSSKTVTKWVVSDSD